MTTCTKLEEYCVDSFLQIRNRQEQVTDALSSVPLNPTSSLVFGLAAPVLAGSSSNLQGTHDAPIRASFSGSALTSLYIPGPISLATSDFDQIAIYQDHRSPTKK